VWAPDRATRFHSTMATDYEVPARDKVVTSPPKYPKKDFPFNPTPEEELRHMTVTNERRTDGDRTTEMISAAEWLKRADANPLVLEGSDRYHRGPPKLPRHSTRDHMSDRNRDQVLFDPARPEIHTTLYVTRRQTMDGNSWRQRTDALAKDQQHEKMRRVLMMQQAERAASDAAEANELLELRSMGIRGEMARAAGQAPPAKRSPAPPAPKSAPPQSQPPAKVPRALRPRRTS